MHSSLGDLIRMVILGKLSSCSTVHVRLPPDRRGGRGKPPGCGAHPRGRGGCHRHGVGQAGGSSGPGAEPAPADTLYIGRQAGPHHACQALVESLQEVEHSDVVGVERRKVGVPVFMMMPLHSVRKDGNGLNRRKAVQSSLVALQAAGVAGIMVDVWWGIAESECPGRYNFTSYMELMEMARNVGLKVQAIMSFHQCGGNVGDSVTLEGADLCLSCI